MLKLSVTKKFTFEACHNLLKYDGNCSRLHGHSYKLYVTVSGNIETPSDDIVATDCMVLDFKTLKDIVKVEVVDKLDHSYLNDRYAQPTAEVMALDIFKTLNSVLPVDCLLEKVRLYETEDSYAEVCRD